MEVIFLFAVGQLNQIYSGLQLINQSINKATTFLFFLSTSRLTISCMPKLINAKLGINDGISHNFII
jgi:hypothetical protein